MKTLTYLSCGALALAMLTSCESKEEKAVKAFAEDFGTKASANKIDELVAVYPDIENADSLALNYVADSVQLVNNEDGTFVITYNAGANLLVACDENGNVTVKESKGIFAYPDNAKKFANEIGGLKADMTDVQVAEVMNDLDAVSAFLMDEYVESRKGAITVSGPTITKDIEFMMDCGEGYYSLNNNTDAPISKDEYTVNSSYESIYADYEGSMKDAEKAGDIPAHGSYKWKFMFSGHTFPDKPTITMNNPTQDAFFANYKAKGDEYARYKKAHPESTGKREKLGDGPYNIAGKLGGKYAIHMTLDKGMKSGSYYYDKSGPKAPMKLNISSFDPKTGKITIQEINNKDNVTGTFEGTLSNEKFEGEMKVFTGKTYTFDLAVTK